MCWRVRVMSPADPPAGGRGRYRSGRGRSGRGCSRRDDGGRDRNRGSSHGGRRSDARGDGGAGADLVPGRGAAERVRLAHRGDGGWITRDTCRGRRREWHCASEQRQGWTPIRAVRGDGRTCRLHHEHAEVIVFDGAPGGAAVTEETGLRLYRGGAAHVGETRGDVRGVFFRSATRRRRRPCRQVREADVEAVGRAQCARVLRATIGSGGQRRDQREPAREDERQRRRCASCQWTGTPATDDETKLLAVRRHVLPNCRVKNRFLFAPRARVLHARERAR